MASFFKWTAIVLVTGVLIGAGALGGLYYYMSRDLPIITTLEDYAPPTVTSVYSDDGRKIGELYKQRRIVIPLEEMPEDLINAFVAAEDSRFREHPGVDIYSIFRAFVKNFKAGTIVQGGSTITQQVAKSFFLTPARTYSRKIKEAILSYRIEKHFTKDQILYLYLNQIYLGHGAYGVEAAAENYFGKHAKDLNLAECSMLAGLPQAPSSYSPFKKPEKARQRQIYVLNRLKQDGYISNLEATEAMNRKLEIKPRKNWFMESVPCYTEHVRRYVMDKYGEEMLYNEGLNIHTAVNIELQKIAREEISKGLKDLDRRQGYRGPLDHLPALKIEEFCETVAEEIGDGSLKRDDTYRGVVTGVSKSENKASVRVGDFEGVIRGETVSWARPVDPDVGYWEDSAGHVDEVFETGDVIRVSVKSDGEASDTPEFVLEQEPEAQASLLSVESETGHVKAMIGGRNFRSSSFNRAIQAKRQPGSAFKPIIYAAALDKGYTPASVIIDSPVVFRDEERDFTWKPRNYHKKFFGPTLLRTALEKSRNVVTIKILKDIGIDYVIDYAGKLGIDSEINQDLSIGLGSSGVSLLEIVKAYSVFSNLGYRVEPTFITKITDRYGQVLEESSVERKKVIDMSTAYIMTSLLEGVVQNGTGRRVSKLDRPVAGKTGTTNNLFDAWFVGYTPRYTTGVWVGFDNEKPLGKMETGSRAASPIWLKYMQKALEGKSVRSFNVPEGVVFAKIDAETGLLPIKESEKVVFECFKEGTVPTEHTPKPDTADEPDELFKDGI
ncbi:MAG: PBP1A family penicillin-binding protein [Desulfobacteraceae bacterium]